jgi:hypothetical protein
MSDLGQSLRFRNVHATAALHQIATVPSRVHLRAPMNTNAADSGHKHRDPEPAVSFSCGPKRTLMAQAGSITAGSAVS